MPGSADRRRARGGSSPVIWPPVIREFVDAVGESSPEAAIARVCADARIELGLVSPPFALGPLLQRLGARTISDPQLGPLARTTTRDGHYQVHLRPDRQWRRQRFTLGHELGHLLLFQTMQRDATALRALTSDSAWPAVERLCDVAATELLMPPEVFRRDLLLQPLSFYRLRQFYDSYLVSWTVLLRRIADVADCFVTLWRRDFSRPDTLISPRLVRFHGADNGPMIPSGLSSGRLTPDLVTFAYAAGTMQADHVSFAAPVATLSGPAIASSWLRPSLPPRFQNMPVPEETSPGYEVFCVIGDLARRRQNPVPIYG